jgi:IclR family pca regulon transcriptional regulator
VVLVGCSSTCALLTRRDTPRVLDGVSKNQYTVLIFGKMGAANPAGLSQSLERGLAVLQAFTPNHPALGISELARGLALTRSTTHRYVATLASLGYLEQDSPTRKYRLGPRVLDLGFSVLASLERREIAAPHLRRLTDSTGHTSNLAIRDDTDVILIDRVRGRPGRYHHLEFSLHVGSRIPA